MATTAFAQFLGAGKGTESNPYQIENTEQFNSLRGMDTSGQYFVLTADIDMTEWLTENNPKNGWAPIPGFSGNLDGQNHIIKTYINRPTKDNVALFASVSNASISNMNLIVDITGCNYVGALVGSMGQSSVINNCHIEGILSGKENIGGLIGSASPGFYSGSINSCSVNADIEGTDYVGGITGKSTSIITGCSFNGKLQGANYCGGIIGYGGINEYRNYGAPRFNRNAVNNCMNEGTIIASGDYCGGIVGSGCSEIIGCINKGDISGDDYVGGIIGFARYLNHSSYYSFDCLINSNVNVSSLVSINNNVGRIIGRIENYADAGSIGSSTENKALNTIVVSINGEEQDIDGDDALNGANYGPRTLKQASAYTSIGWDMEKVWTINSGKDYPTLIIESMGTPNFKSEYEEGAAPTISVGEGTISFSCELDDPTYYYRISFNDESYKFSSTKEPVALPTSFTLSVYATGEGLTTPTTVENIELSQLLNDGNLNGDDTIDITDVTILVNKILEKSGESEE